MATNFTAELVSIDWIVKTLPVAANVAPEDLKPFIITAQDTWIQPVLGSALYQRMMNGVAANDLNGDEDTLRKLIRNALGWFTLYQAMPFMNYKIRNKAIMKGSAENAAAVELKEVQYLREECRSQAEFYTKRVQDHLCNHSASYPQYNANTEEMFPQPDLAYRPEIYLSASSRRIAELRKYYPRTS